MAPAARAEMLIRSPIANVFTAFVEPAWLRKFWLKKASGALAPNTTVEWTFLVPGAHEQVSVKRFVENERIAFDWSDGNSVDMRFASQGRGATRVTVEVKGFKGRNAGAEAVGAAEGFAIVLCDLKSLLETGRSGNMVRDKARLIASSAPA